MPTRLMQGIAVQAGGGRVHAIHRDVDSTPAMADAVDDEIKDLARWLQLELALPR
ncbi:MAG: hypothetical protein ACRDPY_20410 [Streptosporangiaceae bacterium]